MKEITLNNNKIVLVDDDDYEKLNYFKWAYSKSGYALLRNGGVNIWMHRYIMYLKDSSLVVDHINNNRLDNRKSNLRIATYENNSRNTTLSIKNSTGYRGVIRWRNKYKAQIQYGNKHYHLGIFSTKEGAALAYNKEAIKIFGEYAKLNVVDLALEENPKYRTNKTNFIGVGIRYNKNIGYKYVAQLQKKGIKIYIGTFETKEAAALAYNKKAIEVFGKSTKLNNL